MSSVHAQLAAARGLSPSSQTVISPGTDCDRFSELLSEKSSGLLLPPSSADSPFDLEKQRKIVYTMATCHSLRVVDGELLGDPLDVKMFDFTGWSYEEGGSHASEQASPKFDTISPSVAKPPVTHIGESQQNGPNVSCVLHRSENRLIVASADPR